MVTTSVLHGMEAILVQVEADVSPGLPTFEMVGFLSSEVKEGLRSGLYFAADGPVHNGGDGL